MDKVAVLDVLDVRQRHQQAQCDDSTVTGQRQATAGHCSGQAAQQGCEIKMAVENFSRSC
jgi:hypothetical protein